MSAAQPVPLLLSFAHYHQLGYAPTPCDGKVPCYGVGWQSAQHTEAEYQKYDALQRNVGLRCSNIIGLDIDSEDKALSALMERVCRKVLGLPKSTPKRVGKPPKRLLIVRVEEPTRGFDIHDWSDQKNPTMLFQLLGAGKQFIVQGTHPETHKLYTLDRPLPAWSKLPLATPEKLAALRTELVAALEQAGAVPRATGGNGARGNGKWSDPNPWSAVGLAQARKALDKLDPDMGMNQWAKVGFAIHDGTHGSYVGFELWDSWSSEGAKYADNAPGSVAKRWAGFKPGGGTTRASLFKNDWPKRESEEGEDSTGEAVRTPADILSYGLDLSELMVGEYTPIKPIIDGLLYPKGMTMFYGKQKEGKSFALMQVATSCAAGSALWPQLSTSVAKGVPFTGFNVFEPVDVVMLCSEDHSARLQKRFKDLLQRGVLPRPVRRVHILRRDDIMQIVAGYCEENQNGEKVIPEGAGIHILDALIREYAAAGIKVLMLDTVDTIEAMFSVSHAGKDIKRREYAQGTFYDTLADELNIAIIGTGHLRKGKGKSDENLDPMDLVNTTGAANAGISHFWAFTKLPEHMQTIGDGKGKERQFFATGRELEHDPRMHFRQGEEGYGGLWVNYGTVMDVELGAAAARYLNELMVLLKENGGKPVSAEEVSKQLEGVKPATVLRFLKRFKHKGLTFNGMQLISHPGKGGGWTLK